MLDFYYQAAEFLDEKATPEEAAEIKAWLYDVSVKTANAAKEGEFLGFGGKKSSPNGTAQSLRLSDLERKI